MKRKVWATMTECFERQRREVEIVDPDSGRVRRGLGRRLAGQGGLEHGGEEERSQAQSPLRRCLPQTKDGFFSNV
jgi:hypothetical protein